MILQIKHTKRQVAILIFLLTSPIWIPDLKSQDETVPYSWETYGIAFSIPKSFILLENDSIKFSAGDSLINLTIYPVDASGISVSNMDTLLGQWAIQNNVEILSDYNHFNDEEAYYGTVVGGISGDFNIMLLLFIDPEYSDTGFYIWLSYQDDSLDKVIRIIDSFYPI
jgi:hypothetical protein